MIDANVKVALCAAIGGMSRHRVQTMYELTSEEMDYLDGLVPSPWLASRKPNTSKATTEARYLANVYEAYVANNMKPLSTGTYNKWAQAHNATQAGAIVNLFGSWRNACKEAEVISVDAPRRTTDYELHWSEEDVNESIEDFTSYCIAQNHRPTTHYYEQYRRKERANGRPVPSLSILRRRYPIRDIWQESITDKLETIHADLLQW